MPQSKDAKTMVHTESAAMTEVPEWLKESLGDQQGMEDVENTDLLIPRLGLCQSLSPQRRKGDPTFIPGLEEGQLFNTVTQEIYGSELELIILFFFKNRIKFNPISDGGGIDCNSPNGIDGGRISPQGCASCQFSAWGNGADPQSEEANTPPICTLYHNFMSQQGGAPIAMSFKSTGLKKVSKPFLAMVRISNLPMYAKKYKISSMEMRDGQNMWYEKKITPIGFVTKEEMVKMKELYDGLKALNVHIDTTGEEGDTSFNPEGSHTTI